MAFDSNVSFINPRKLQVTHRDTYTYAAFSSATSGECLSIALTSTWRLNIRIYPQLRMGRIGMWPSITAHLS